MTTGREVRIDLSARGGAVAGLEFGPADRPLDVLFAHANGFNARTYAGMLAPLTHLRVLAVDLRGHGATTLPTLVEDHPGWTVFRDDLLAVLEAVAAGPVLLAGHSMGATTSLLMAAAAPERVKAVAMFEPVLMPLEIITAFRGSNPLSDGALRRRSTYPDRATALESYRGRGAFRGWHEDQLADYVAAGFRDTDDGQVTLACAPEWEAACYRVHFYDPWAALADSRCPVRLVKGEHHSTAHTHGHAALMADRGVTVETVAGTSHFLPMERPDVVTRVVGEMAG